MQGDHEDDFHNSEMLDKGKNLQSITRSRCLNFYWTKMAVSLELINTMHDDP